MIEEWYQKYYGVLCHRAGTLVGYDRAEDIVQETFVRAIRTPCQSEKNVFGWLYAITTNLCRDALRQNGVRAKHHVEATLEECEPYVARDNGLSLIELQELIEQLPPRQRLAILLHIDGKRGEAAARAFGRTRVTFHSAMRAAKQHLRESLKGKEVDHATK